MRPQQQNRRMRGRNNNGGGGGGNNNNNNNNNRKGPNPLTRNYESNGPDVKIRGSAQQIAEKYATLARDAQSSGDRVMAENYLQHAEHYNRIIAAAQAQMPIQNAQQNRDDFDDDGDDERDEFDNNSNNNGNNNIADAPVPAINHGSGPQPVIDGTPAEVALNSDGGRDGNNNRDQNNGGRNNGGRDGNGRHRERRPNGGYGQNGQRNDYNSRGEQNARGEQNSRPEQSGVEQGEYRGDQSSAPEAQFEQTAPQPVVAPGPIRQPEHLSPADLAAQAELNEGAASEAAAPRKPRRPRRPRVEQAEGDAAVENASEPSVTE